MLHDFDDQDTEVSDINMVPLIDVMLVLLIIFMITMPVLAHRVKVDLPRAVAATDDVKPERVTLAVDAGGRVHWNDQPVDEAALQARLEAAARQDPQPELHIRGDRKAEYESVLRVMAAAQRAGVLKLGFVTDPGDADGQAHPSTGPDVRRSRP
ncbi:MAG: biopolymer transporter ExbD [Burkholderiales bacterium]|nr:biopolymer transporter ExbD [Burkholderiales bacterium]OJX03991.1 MAG: biopolymer transporter ExbD [Burkholderiales bacterium 70-64]